MATLVLTDVWEEFDQKARSEESAYEKAALGQFASEATAVEKLLTSSVPAFKKAGDPADAITISLIWPYIEAAFLKIMAAYSSVGTFTRQWYNRFRPIIAKTMAQSEAPSVRVGILGPTSPQMVSAIQRRVTKLANNVTETTAQQIRDVMTQARADGVGVSELARRIRSDVFGDAISTQRATTIARTECLPPDARVNSARITALYRRWYDGSMVTVTTFSGRKITGTPNHPVLTMGGWRGLGELAKGDRLICNAADIDPARATGDENVQYRPPTIAEIFDAAAAVVVTERERGRQPDFHGDGSDGDVDVLRPDSVLLVRDFAPLDERSVQVGFAGPDMTAVFFAARRAPFRRDIAVDTATGFGHGAPRNTGIVEHAGDELHADAELLAERFRRCSRLVRGDDAVSWHVAPEATPAIPLPEMVGAGSLQIAGDASRAHDIRDAGLVAPLDAGDLTTTEPLPIEIDDVLSISVRPYSGHVYNLTTVDGYFLTSEIYTSNTVGALNEGAWVKARAGGVSRAKHWVDQKDGRVRDSHRTAASDGWIPIDQPHSNGLQYPHEPGAPAAEVIQCRCTEKFTDQTADEANRGAG